MSAALIPAPHTQASLDTAWAAIGEPGGWLSARERIAVAAEARGASTCSLCAERKAALSPFSVDGEHDAAEPGLRDALRRAVHAIASDPGRLSERWYDAACAEGLEPEEIVEATAVIGVVTAADTYARAIDADARPLPDVTNDAVPARRRLSGTTLERGWVPMVDPDSAEGFVKTLYDGIQTNAGFVFNVSRSLTSVPEAAQHFFGVMFVNYSTHGEVREGGLTRMQVELLASTTSAHNDCFY